jgi:hypothetical protein
VKLGVAKTVDDWYVRPPHEAGRLVDNMDEPMLPDAALNGTAAIGTAEDPGSVQRQVGTNDTGGGERGALLPTFLSGLATAMREAAVRERERISSAVAEDAAAHIEKVRSRAGVESEELRRLAEEDVEHVEQWSAAEIDRIRAEAAQKVDDRRSSLDEYLRQHDSIIETEIEGVNGAVRDYESTLDSFFAELSEIGDASEIVRRAGLLPTPPDLDEIRATARANAMASISESEAASAIATAEPAESPAETVATEPAESTAETVATSEPVAAPDVEPVEAMAEAGTSSVDADASGTSDDGTMIGVMDDGGGSIEPVESTETPVESVAAEETPANVGQAEAEMPVEPETPAEPSAEPLPEPVGVMDPGAQRAPNWPAPAPEAPPAQIAPTIDHTSAAVRLLRSVAPWTAPTHAGNRASSDSD